MLTWCFFVLFVFGENREEGSKGEVKGGYSRSRANLNGGELDCENTSGTHKGSYKEGLLSQGQSKWWRAGRRTFSPQWWLVV